jgi:RNA polymerase sigma factor (sigma-70 family)
MTTLEFSYSITSFYPKLKSFALKLTRDMEDAEDLIQETLLKAFSNRNKFEDGTNLKAWTYTIMKNTFITNYQRIARRKTFIDSSENLYHINSASSKVENDAVNKFTNADIQHAMSKLEEVYKIPFDMFFSGYKYHEIADHLSIPIGTVKNRIHIARKELKESLKLYALA